MTASDPLTRRESRRVRRFLAATMRTAPTGHAPGQHSWSTFESTVFGRRRIPDFAVCSCGEIRRAP